MIRPLVFLGLLACLAASGARADPSLVEKAFGNTIVSTYPDGRTAELWLKPDGSYTAEGRRHDPSRGHWRVKDARLCLSQVRPIPLAVRLLHRHTVLRHWPGVARKGGYRRADHRQAGPRPPWG